jgi:hypothetical protein
MTLARRICSPNLKPQRFYAQLMLWILILNPLAALERGKRKIKSKVEFLPVR